MASPSDPSLALADLSTRPHHSSKHGPLWRGSGGTYGSYDAPPFDMYISTVKVLGAVFSDLGAVVISQHFLGGISNLRGFSILLIDDQFLVNTRQMWYWEAYYCNIFIALFC